MKLGWLEAARAEAEKRPASKTDWCPHEPTGKQAEFLRHDCLEALYGGAAGGGKSDALGMAALAHVDVPGYSAILFRRTYSDLALPGAIMDRIHEWLGGSAARWNDRDKRWTFPSGATLVFGYLDGPRDHFRYQSSEFQFIGFDEVTQFEERQYRYLFSRLRRTAEVSVPLRMRSATNPGGIGHEWVKRRFLDEPQDRVFVPAKLDDNPHLDAEQYEVALAQLDPITRKQLRDGLWIQDTSGLVYYSFSEKNLGRALPQLRDRETWTRVLGMDFGVTDPTAFVELAFTEHDQTVYVTRSGQWPDLAPSDASDIAKQWEKDAGGYDAIVGDTGGLGKAFQAEWSKRYHWMRSAQKGDKLGFVKLINGDFHHGRVVVLDGNDELVTDLRALAWKDEQHKAEHPGLPNHLTDALLYGWREARHWAWEERPPDLTMQQIREKAEDERLEKLLQRNRERELEEDEEWTIYEQ